jgi:hypothetical protein
VRPRGDSEHQSRKTRPKTRPPSNTLPVGALIPQPHGGALRNGGPGSPGRPPSALRDRLRGSFAERVLVLEAIADDDQADPQDRIRAIDVLAKYGLGTLRELSVDDVRDRLRKTIAIVREHMAPDDATVVLTRLREVWTK